MLDLNYIRKNAEEVKLALINLNVEAPIDEILELDTARREVLKAVENLRAERNSGSKIIGGLMREGKKDEAEAQKKHMSEIGDKISTLNEKLNQIESNLTEKQLWVPNMPHPSVPIGPDEDHNIEVRVWYPEGQNNVPQFNFEIKPHWELAEALGIIDFERGIKMSGSRFYMFRGAGAALHRALTNWFLDMGTLKHGYTEIYPPFMVREKAMVGAAHLPKFRDNMYYDAEEDYWFIGTAEVPLTNMFADEILDEADLPLKFVAHTPCFRREKFSAGRDVRGIKRVHQFEKVEMYQFATPETSYQVLDEIVSHVENLVQQLKIPYRVVEICTGDLGFAAAKKFDIEIWSPGNNEWMEISSVSNVESFQARRVNTRFRRKDGGKPEFIHTLNGSGLPPGRVMIAVLENYQQADGSIIVPEVLQPYMGGIEKITA